MQLVPTAAPLQLHHPIPQSVYEMLSTSGSPAGHSAISSYLACPERARLRSLGIRRIPYAGYDDGLPTELDELGYGTLIHALLAVRIIHGYDVALWLAEASPLAQELHPADQLKASTLLRFYNGTYPLEEEPFEYLGVEAYVASALPFAPSAPPAVRTVKYDAVVRMKADGWIFSLEHKTASRASSSLWIYYPQMAWQQALWNLNPYLVQTYGPMRGVIIDQLVKTEVPKCERLGPTYFSKLQEQRIIEYMRLPELIAPTLPVNPDGSHPRMFHNCTGRYRPCEYINLCWENLFGDYEQVKP